ncbi:MAG: hypothetical protein CME62_15410 [Halobacteriovoraceae bacterium]|nr:hypothetical protein [Halobacteriovoraceae bacterium]
MTLAKLKSNLSRTLSLLFLGLVISCMPQKFEVQERIPADTSEDSVVTDPIDNNDTEGEIRTLPQSNNFLQQSSTSTLTTLNLFADFKDTFLLRGNNLISFLQEKIKTSQSNFCLVTEFQGASGTSGAKPIMVLSARIRSFYSSILNTQEYFLQMDANNKTMNQSDCLTVGLTNEILEEYGSSSIAYSLEDICPSCKINIKSESLALFSKDGTQIDDVATSHLFLNIIPAAGGSSGEINSCSNNSSCTDIGFNCCLSGQCVNHGEVRPNVSTTSDKYQVALELITNRPELIVNYEDVFYVCPEMVPTDATNNDDDEGDPTQQAADLLTELTDIYNCLNPVIDEISVCKLSFEDASELMSAGTHPFTAPLDDLTFSSLNPSMTGQNIAQINYAGKTYFKEKLFEGDTEVALNPGVGSFGTSNDDLNSFQTAHLQIPLPADATHDTLDLYYKIDGSCEVLGSSLARCTKKYVQAQNSTVPRSSDHTGGSQTFLLPSYADTSFNVVVSVGGANISQGSETWSLSGNSVVFDGDDYPIFDNQTVEITYYVSDKISVLTASKQAAQEKLNEHCACDPLEDPCNLTPVTSEVNGVNTVTSYACEYPEVEGEDIPLQETVFVSAKSVPHKFYDKSGVNYDLGEIGSAFEQEGEEFKYTDGNNLKPNNITNDIGFNEIYGSMNRDGASPLPPTVIDVDKGKNYDIFVDSGAFSTCLNCGSDYFSSLQKIFPNNFRNMGAGYFPDFVESRRQTNQGDFNADDFRFGRACFVPATMLPWTHAPNADVATQRQNRLAAQHFLFANGYNKDWYGFDYGSLIGSYDGVKWFAIGNQRRIKADGNKLYLAVNAYFGDLTINNTFKVTINETTSVVGSGTSIAHDLDSDGAECQKAHICETDEDCITNLGYDYTCQNVGSLVTPWPIFDSNGNEISGSTTKTIASLIGGTNNKPKRCVYRGQGAICEQQSHSVSSTNSYSSNSLAAFHACSSNTYCESLSENKFNRRISRYAESPKSQNVQSFITEETDTFGLAARVLGRPYDFYGEESVDSDVANQFSSLNVRSLCIPGRDPAAASTTEDANFVVSNREADKIANVGRTMNSSFSQNENYFALCPSTDEDGTYTHLTSQLLNNSDHKIHAIRNNLSTNSLLLASFDRLNLFNDDEEPVESMGLHKNTCLRAPGAKCFSDFECAPSKFVAEKVKSLSSANGEISEAEKEFWEQELVCGSSQDRYTILTNNTGSNVTVPDPDYDTTAHHCCREVDKEFTYHSQTHENSEFKVVDDAGNILIPGVNQDIDDPERYSRTHTVYDQMMSDPDRYPALVSASSQPIAQLLLTGDTIRQYNTLHLHNERMCCSNHWVREFASGSNGNGGGHKFGPSKQQNMDLEIFKPLSWNANNVPALNTFPASSGYDPSLLPYTCTPEDIFTADCEIKNIGEGSFTEQLYLSWFRKLELIGIPQVLIETNNTVFLPLTTEEKDYDGDGIDESSQASITSSGNTMSNLKLPLENTIKDVNTEGVADVSYNGEDYYSASSYDNFEMGSSKMKKVFSENTFNCCMPAGTAVGEADPDSICCTGYKESVEDNTIASNQQRCCLQDFADVSIYTNRYVSSEGATLNGERVSDGDVDPESGYLRKEIVMEMAKTMCCSGRAILGKSIGDYLIPVDFDQQFQNNSTRRWLYLDSLDDATESCGGATKFKAGARWNDHVYCAPAAVADESCEGGGIGGSSSSGSSSSGGSGSGSGNNVSSTLE